MTIQQSSTPAAPATEPIQAATAQTQRSDFEIRFPALKGVLAASAAVRAPKPLPKERDLPPILRKAAFED